MRLTNPRDVVEGNISEQRDEMIVNRGRDSYRRRDLIVEVKAKPTCDRWAHSALKLSAKPYISCPGGAAGEGQTLPACLLFMPLYYLTIPQSMKRLDTSQLETPEELSHPTASFIKARHAVTVGADDSKRSKMLLWTLDKCCYTCKQF